MVSGSLPKPVSIACRGNRGYVARFSDFVSAGRRLDVLMTGKIRPSMGVSVGALRVQTVIGAALMTGRRYRFRASSVFSA